MICAIFNNIFSYNVTKRYYIIVYYFYMNYFKGHTEHFTFVNTKTEVTSIALSFYSGLFAYNGWLVPIYNVIFYWIMVNIIYKFHIVVYNIFTVSSKYVHGHYTNIMYIYRAIHRAHFFLLIMNLFKFLFLQFLNIFKDHILKFLGFFCIY